MEGNWVLKVNTKQKMPYDLYRLLHRKSTKYRNNYCFNNYVEKPKRTIKKIQKAGIKYECYRVEYERANNYRQTLLRQNTGPVQMRYCNKKLQKNKVVVDQYRPGRKSTEKSIRPDDAGSKKMRQCKRHTKPCPGLQGL